MILGSLVITLNGYTWHWDGWPAIGMTVLISAPVYWVAFRITFGTWW